MRSVNFDVTVRWAFLRRYLSCCPEEAAIVCTLLQGEARLTTESPAPRRRVDRSPVSAQETAAQ